MKDYPMLYILIYFQEVLLNICIAEQEKELFCFIQTLNK